FGLAHEDLAGDGLRDLVVVAPDVLAVLLQHFALVGEVVRLAREVRPMRVPGDDAERELLAAATDPDRRMRALHRFRVALRAGELEVAAVVFDLGLGPHQLHDLDGLAQHPDAHLRLGELVAVAPELAVVPTGADAPIESTTADDVDRARDLGQQRGIAIRRAPDHLAESHTVGALACRRHYRPA